MNRIAYPYCLAAGRIWLVVLAGLFLTGLSMTIAKGAGSDVTLSGFIEMSGGQVAVLAWILSAVFGIFTFLSLGVLASAFVVRREVALTPHTISAPPHWLRVKSTTIDLSGIQEMSIEGKGSLAILRIKDRKGAIAIPALCLPHPYGISDLHDAVKLRMRPLVASRAGVVISADGLFGQGFSPARAFGRRVQ